MRRRSLLVTGSIPARLHATARSRRLFPQGRTGSLAPSSQGRSCAAIGTCRSRFSRFVPRMWIVSLLTSCLRIF